MALCLRMSIKTQAAGPRACPGRELERRQALAMDAQDPSASLRVRTGWVGSAANAASCSTGSQGRPRSVVLTAGASLYKDQTARLDWPRSRLSHELLRPLSQPFVLSRPAPDADRRALRTKVSAMDGIRLDCCCACLDAR